MKQVFNVDIKARELDWLGSVVNWVTETIQSMAGSLVSQLIQ